MIDGQIEKKRISGAWEDKVIHKEIAYLITSTSPALRGGTTLGIGGEVQ